jgi:hypothetical protein
MFHKVSYPYFKNCDIKVYREYGNKLHIF